MCNLKDLSPEVIAEETALVIKYSGRHDGAVKRIAQKMHLQPRTVYDIMECRIKPSLLYLHACCEATDGDPDIKKFLEPDGFQLVPKGVAVADKDTLAEECLDDLPALAAYHHALNDPDAREVEVIMAKDNLIREIEENHNQWRHVRHAIKGGVIKKIG
jgi:hypothetical protein